MSTKANTSANLAEVIPIRRNMTDESERLAELDERIKAAVELAGDLIMERIKLERGEAA